MNLRTFRIGGVHPEEEISFMRTASGNWATTQFSSDMAAVLYISSAK